MQKVFIEGSITDVRDHFQVNRERVQLDVYSSLIVSAKKLMSYCADDVRATCEVVKKVYPLFEER
jgi:hypothetical protein